MGLFQCFNLVYGFCFGDSLCIEHIEDILMHCLQLAVPGTGIEIMEFSV